MTKKLLDVLVCYDSDASRISGDIGGVIFPRKSEKICDVVKTSKLDIVPRGAGTGLMGGCVPKGSVVIDVSKMNSVGKLDKKHREIYVEAGVTVKELNEKLKKAGLEFPIYMIERSFSTIGGLIALGVLGDRSMRYGELKDWIEEIDFVSGRGELVKLSKADLTDVCGMEGLTGIIVGAKLKAAKLIKRSASIFQSDELDEILAISRRLRLEKEVVMLRFLSKDVSKMLGLPLRYHIIIEFNSNRGKIKDRDYENLMNLVKKNYYALYSRGYYNSEDPKLFFDKIKEFALFLESLNIPYFGDLGMGIIHPFFKDNDERKEAVMSFIRKIKTKLSKYGIGLKRKDFLEEPERKLMSRVKLRHDPFVKINKGKVMDIEQKSSKFDKVHKDFDIGVGKIKSAEKIVEEVVEEMPVKRIILPEHFENNIAADEKQTLDSERIVIKKTPEQKMKEFVERVERESEFTEKEKEEKEIYDQLEDYEQTFKSELSEDRVEKISDFARDVSKKVLIKDNLNISELKSPNLKPLSSASPDFNKGFRTDEEKALIDNVMMNQFGMGSAVKEEKKEKKDNDNRI